MTAIHRWDYNSDCPRQAFEDRKHQKSDAGTHYAILSQTQIPGVIAKGRLLPQGPPPNETGIDSIATKSLDLQAENATNFDHDMARRAPASRA